VISLRKASSSDRLQSLLKLANVSRASESGGSLDKAPLSRFRMMPGFAGPAGTFLSTDGRREGVVDSATESRSSGVGGRLGKDDRVRGRFEEEEGSSDSRSLLAGMFSRLDEAN
jgi:hypothetical protein